MIRLFNDKIVVNFSKYITNFQFYVDLIPKSYDYAYYYALLLKDSSFVLFLEQLNHLFLEDRHIPPKN